MKAKLLMHVSGHVQTESSSHKAKVLLDTDVAINIMPLPFAKQHSLPINTEEIKKVSGFNQVLSTFMSIITTSLRIGSCCESIQFDVLNTPSSF